MREEVRQSTPRVHAGTCSESRFLSRNVFSYRKYVSCILRNFAGDFLVYFFSLKSAQMSAGQRDFVCCYLGCSDRNRGAPNIPARICAKGERVEVHEKGTFWLTRAAMRRMTSRRQQPVSASLSSSRVRATAAFGNMSAVCAQLRQNATAAPRSLHLKRTSRAKVT